MSSPVIFPNPPTSEIQPLAPPFGLSDLVPFNHTTKPEFFNDETETLNRRGYNLVLNLAKQVMPGSFGLIEGDVDGLGEINTTQGYEAGTQYLRLAVNALRGVTRPTDLMYPFHKSGDEMSVVALNVNTQEAIDGIVARIGESMLRNGVSATFVGRLHQVRTLPDGTKVPESLDSLKEGVDLMLRKQKIQAVAERLTPEQFNTAVSAVEAIIAAGVNPKDAYRIHAALKSGASL